MKQKMLEIKATVEHIHQSVLNSHELLGADEDYLQSLDCLECYNSGFVYKLTSYDEEPVLTKCPHCNYE